LDLAVLVLALVECVAASVALLLVFFSTCRVVALVRKTAYLPSRIDRDSDVSLLAATACVVAIEQLHLAPATEQSLGVAHVPCSRIQTGLRPHPHELALHFEVECIATGANIVGV
jgi:hypothetical protein